MHRLRRALPLLRRRLSSVSLTFIDRESNQKQVPAAVGKTVLDAALANDIDIEAACGGEMACSTCHVILDEATFNDLGQPSEEEQDMLDLAWGLTKTSRLCCQVKVTADLTNATFTLPDEPEL